MLKRIKTGLKVFAVTFLSGVIVWFVSLIFNIFGLNMMSFMEKSASLFFVLLLIFGILILLFNFYVMGWIADKLWGWD